VELKQKLNDAEKEAKENLRLVEHWQDEHDKLKLEEIE
jgi:structural maintenance of chromosome 4